MIRSLALALVFASLAACLPAKGDTVSSDSRKPTDCATRCSEAAKAECSAAAKSECADAVQEPCSAQSKSECSEAAKAQCAESGKQCDKSENAAPAK